MGWEGNGVGKQDDLGFVTNWILLHGVAGTSSS